MRDASCIGEQRDWPEYDLADDWSHCLPATCPVHRSTLAVPGNCSTAVWHCLPCVLEAASVELGSLLFAAGCHPFAAPHLLLVEPLPKNATPPELTEKAETSLPPTYIVVEGV